MDMRQDLSALNSCLVLHFHAQDKAIGLSRPSKRTKVLAWHYYQKEWRLYQDAFLIGYIKQCSETITALVNKIDETTPESELIETGNQVEQLNQAIKEAQSQMSKSYG